MTDEEKKDETPVAEPPKVEWKYKESFAIGESMREIIGSAIKMAQGEVEIYRRKLKKLTYGA